MTGYNFYVINGFLLLKIFYVIANCVDPDEKLHYAAFHLGLHCLPKNHLGVTSIEGLSLSAKLLQN